MLFPTESAIIPQAAFTSMTYSFQKSQSIGKLRVLSRIQNLGGGGGGGGGGEGEAIVDNVVVGGGDVFPPA